MTLSHSSHAVLALALVLAGGAAPGRAAPSQDPDTTQSFTVFLRSRPIGQETLTVVQQAGGWLIRGSNRLGPPLDVVTRTAEIQYDAKWHPSRLLLEGTSRGQEVTVATTFENGEARSDISVAGTPSTETDKVTADTIVLPNAFLGSYAALARRLVGQKAGATFRGYIAPQGEIAIYLDGVFAERIETPQRAIAATRYALTVSNAPPGSDVAINVWTDPSGALLRLSVPAQMLELARDDVASAATRTTSFSVPGDETVRIPASGFSMAGSMAKPATANGPLPAVILIGDAESMDRDGSIAGIPVIGQIAADLVEAGFLVVRYDRRGMGQSGGRAETATLNDYAEDVRAIIEWLEDRDDVDEDRIALVGHSEGAWVAMRAAARDRRVDALALIGAASSTGAELVLEQQQMLLDSLETPEAEKQAKIDLQKRINAAALDDGEWEGIPDALRAAADTPWFESYLAFDPARVMRDIRQPVLIVQGELDREVPPHHADRLAELARARRRRNASVDIATIPGVNHLLVPATTGAISEYPTLADRKVSAAATSAIAAWITKILG